ncbi:cohesin complex subunit SA-1/2 [Angomonas deanei]|uniref:STAG domain containing protein, putative n=1 Tax=Angomonas deanei TaxID=59799 RepID=A0A7G2C8D8_9TRYP|nr:cohesin complex subunit SA-1/2 [Angomonas deanei]CAD2214262.1 STAG domain containing protein, putative [Angomonas deanei]|eukprot:EPY27584.1 cohesin complex subunit SA-1/2 [Angomonas deanei]
MPPKRKTVQKKVVRKDESETFDDDFNHAATPKEEHASGEPDMTLCDSTLEALIDDASVNSVADTLLNVYRSGEPKPAICAIINMMVKASGVAHLEELKPEEVLVEGMNITPILEELYVRVQTDSAAYFLANKEAKYKKFKKNFPLFFERLISLALSSDVLFDSFFMPTVKEWLVTMSESKARSFRHTSTVAILGVIHGFNKLQNELKDRLPLAKSKKETKDLQTKLEEITEWRGDFFAQAIHRRLRDIAPEIRLTVFQFLKEWILEFPDEFMDNKYLRYFNIPLHDKKPELRAEGLNMILQALATVDDAYNRLHLFLKYFVERIVEMTNDTDVRCAELAIRVVTMMVRGDNDTSEGNELLSEDMIDRALLTIFDERPTIRGAAGILMKIFVHCRTDDGESKEEQISEATQLLMSFALTLRSQYNEEMPERYLVDALWSNERPPPLLTEYKNFLDVTRSATASMDCVVALHFISSLLLKLQGKLTLGPLPKDDRRHGTKKPSASTQQTIHELIPALSKDVAPVVSAVLSKFSGSEEVLIAIASVLNAVDIDAFTQQQQSLVTSLLAEVRKATMNATLNKATRNVLCETWNRFALSETPFKRGATAHVKEMVKTTFQQIRDKETTAKRNTFSEDSISLWNRMYLLVSLQPVDEDGGLFPVVKSTLPNYVSHLLSAPSQKVPLVLQAISAVMGCGMQCCLWGVNALQSGGTVDASAARGQIRDFIEALFVLLTEGSGTEMSTEVSDTLTEAFLTICDLTALNYTDLLPKELESFFKHFELLFITKSGEYRECVNTFKECNAASAEGHDISSVAQAKVACSRQEAYALRLITGVSRLFLFKRLDISSAPRVLSLWTTSTSKAVSDTFKSLFHTLRDRVGFNDALETNILLEAYNRCAEVGATPVSVEALYQIGAKLASLHFIGTDRYYPTVKEVIQFGINFSVSTDPLILHGVVPYCVKLHHTDALEFIQSMSTMDVFTSMDNPYARVFVGAMRKAARLEGATPGQTPMGSKRRRTMSSMNDDNADGLLAEIVRGVPDKKSGARLSMSTRVVTADGWRTNPDATQTTTLDEEEENINVLLTPAEPGKQTAAQKRLSRRKTQESVVSVPTTQEIQGTVNKELDSEVFIATEEFD